MESDKTVIPKITDSVSVADENDNKADSINIQMMILTENMAVFLNKSNISDSLNMQISFWLVLKHHNGGIHLTLL